MHEEESLIHVAIKGETLFHIGPIAVTNSMVGTLIATVVLASLAFWASRNSAVVPGRLQSFLEFPLEFVFGHAFGSGLPMPPGEYALDVSRIGRRRSS